MELAWHFVNGELRDGRPIPPDGFVLVHDGPLKLCESGYHASTKLLDALEFAPGPIVCRVELGGAMLRDADKIVAQRRTIIWRSDITGILRAFARRCALDVIDLWDAPRVVRQFLETGDESIAAAASDTAIAAEYAAASEAASAAASAAASEAASEAASAAASAAASEAASEAASDAAKYAASAAASEAASAAAWAAATAAATAAARYAQNNLLETMVFDAERQKAGES